MGDDSGIKGSLGYAETVVSMLSTAVPSGTNPSHLELDQRVLEELNTGQIQGLALSNTEVVCR